MTHGQRNTEQISCVRVHFGLRSETHLSYVISFNYAHLSLNKSVPADPSNVPGSNVLFVIFRLSNTIL